MRNVHGTARLVEGYPQRKTLKKQFCCRPPSRPIDGLFSFSSSPNYYFYYHFACVRGGKRPVRGSEEDGKCNELLLSEHIIYYPVCARVVCELACPDTSIHSTRVTSAHRSAFIVSHDTTPKCAQRVPRSHVSVVRVCVCTSEIASGNPTRS